MRSCYVSFVLIYVTHAHGHVSRMVGLNIANAVLLNAEGALKSAGCLSSSPYQPDQVIKLPGMVFYWVNS
jgi:hypothetical protein